MCYRYTSCYPEHRVCDSYKAYSTIDLFYHCILKHQKKIKFSNYLDSSIIIIFSKCYIKLHEEPSWTAIGFKTLCLFTNSAPVSEQCYLPAWHWHWIRLPHRRLPFSDTITFPESWSAFLLQTLPLRIKWDILTWLLSAATTISSVWWSLEPVPARQGGGSRSLIYGILCPVLPPLKTAIIISSVAAMGV